VQRTIVTFVWWGKKRREWGFHTPNGWTPWRDYFDRPAGRSALQGNKP
jgi:hypothetical protein